MIRLGWWTPAAGVLCADGCSTPSMTDVPLPGEAETLCDLCRNPISVRDDVAQLHNIVLELNAQGIPGAHMEQTGGMCSALAVRMEGGTLVGTEYGFSFHPGSTWDEGEGEDAIEIVADDEEIISLVLSHLSGGKPMVIVEVNPVAAVWRHQCAVVRVRDAGSNDTIDVTVVFLNGDPSIAGVLMGRKQLSRYPFPVDEEAVMAFATEAIKAEGVR